MSWGAYVRPGIRMKDRLEIFASHREMKARKFYGWCEKGGGWVHLSCKGLTDKLDHAWFGTADQFRRVEEEWGSRLIPVEVKRNAAGVRVE